MYSPAGIGVARFYPNFAEAENLVINPRFVDGFDQWVVESGDPRVGVVSIPVGESVIGGPANISKISQVIVFGDDDFSALSSGAGLSVSSLIRSGDGVDYCLFEVDFFYPDGTDRKYTVTNSQKNTEWVRRGAVIYPGDAVSVKVIMTMVRNKGTWCDGYCGDFSVSVVDE